MAVHSQKQHTAVRQPHFDSPAGARPVAPRAASVRRGDGSSFFSDAVSELGQAPSAAALKKASAHADLSFDAAARSELAPAPRMSTLRSMTAGPHTSQQQQLASMTVTQHGKAPAGYAGRQFSLARDSRESAGDAAYDFGRELASRRPRPAATAAGPAPAVHNTFSAAKKWQQQQAARKPRTDSWGIPRGANQVGIGGVPVPLPVPNQGAEVGNQVYHVQVHHIHKHLHARARAHTHTFTHKTHNTHARVFFPAWFRV